MAISSSSILSALSSGSAPASVPQKSLGKDDFLRLLTTQLANQDPLKPVDNQAFIAQLAQFSSVEQLSNVGTDLEKLLVAQGSQNALSAASLVGKQVVYQADGVDLAAGGTAALSTTLTQSASVTVAIQDQNGRVVRTLALGQKDAGSVAIAWDGRDDAGNQAPAGRYSVTAVAKTAAGDALSLTPQATGVVQGAAFDGTSPILLVGGSRVNLSDVLEIHQG